MSIQFVNKGGKTPILQEKSITITSNGTTNVTPDTGYDGLSEVGITTNVSGGGSKSVLPNGTVFHGSEFTTFNTNNFDFSEITKISNMFNSCTSLVSLDLSGFNIKSTSSISNFLSNCRVLTDVDVSNINLSNMTIGSSGNSVANAFATCPELSNASLNSILKMCSSNTRASAGKTLAKMGLTSEQATICQSLSNYQDFLNARWTTGY